MASHDPHLQRDLQIGGIAPHPIQLRSPELERDLRAGGVLTSPVDTSLARDLEAGFPDPRLEVLQLFEQSRSPVQQLGDPDLEGFLTRTGRVFKRIGSAMWQSVSFWEPDISGRQRVARAATLGSLFVPIAGTAQLGGRLGIAALRSGTRLKPMMAATAAQEAALGAALAKLHDEGMVFGALSGGLLGAGGGALVARAKRAATRSARATAAAAFRDPQRFTDLRRTPLHNHEFAVISAERTEYPAHLNVQRTEKLFDELVADGYEPIPVEGFYPFDRTAGDPADLASRFKEDSFIVPGMTRDDALRYATRYDQDFVITREGLFNPRDLTFQALQPQRTRFGSGVSLTDDFFTRIRVGDDHHVFALGFDSEWQPIGKTVARPRFPDEPEKAIDAAIHTGTGAISAAMQKLRAWPASLRLGRAYNSFIDRNYGFARLDKVLGIRGGEGAITASHRELAQLSYGGAYSVAEHNLRWGLVSVEDRSIPIRPGLFQILERIQPEDYQAFVRYGFARRWLAIHRATERKLPLLKELGRRITVEELESIIASAPREFDAVFRDVVDWRNTLLTEYLGRTGILTRKQLKAILSSEDFVPLRRGLDELVERTNINRAEDLFAIHDPVERLKALGDQYLDWIDVLMKETVVFSKIAADQRVFSRLIETFKANPEFLRSFAVHVRRPKFKLSKAHREALEAIKDSDPALYELVRDTDEGILAMIAPQVFSGGKHYIGGLVKGKRTWYEIRDELLWDSIRSMSPIEQGLFGRILSSPVFVGPASGLRAGATLAFEFMARNPLRDVMFATVTAGVQRPGAALAGAAVGGTAGYAVGGEEGAVIGATFGGAFGATNFLSGIASALRQDEWFKRWTAGGGPRAALVSQDRNVNRLALLKATGLSAGAAIRTPRDIIRHPAIIGLEVLKHPLDSLRALSELMESGTRLGIFKAQYPKLVAQGLTPTEAIERAALSTRNASVDFRVHGVRTQALARSIAFWNPMLQSYRTMIEAMRRDPAGVAARAVALITVPSILLYMLNRNDPDYAQLEPWERNLFWHIRGPEGKWLRYPKPFELGAVFGSMVEHMLAAMDAEDPGMLDRAFAEMGMDLLKDFLPIPTTIHPVLERLMNYNLFTERPIIPRGQEDVVPRYRAKPNTSDLAQGLVKYLHLDELGIDAPTLDHVLWGYTGGLGRFGTDIADAIIAVSQGSEDAVPEWHDMPAIRGFVSRFPEGNRAAEEFYRFADEVRKASYTAARLEREMRLEDLEELYAQRGELIAIAPDVQHIVDELAQLRQQRHQVEASEHLSVDLRREIVDYLVDAEYRLALQAGELIRAVRPPQTSP